MVKDSPLVETKEKIALPTYDQLSNLKKKAAVAEGYNAWSYYRLGGDSYSLEDVIANLKQLASGNILSSKSIDSSHLEDFHRLLCRRYFKDI